MGVLYGVDGDLLERQYRNHLSGYLHWDQLVHAEDWLLFEKNIGAYICIDEVALSRGELYTVLTNKEAHGGKGSMIAIIKGTDVHTVTSVLLKLPSPPLPCLLYTSPSPRDMRRSRMPSSA